MLRYLRLRGPAGVLFSLLLLLAQLAQTGGAIAAPAQSQNHQLSSSALVLNAPANAANLAPMKANDNPWWIPGVRLELLNEARRRGFQGVEYDNSGPLGWWFVNPGRVHIGVGDFSATCNNDWPQFGGRLQALPDHPGVSAGYSWTCFAPRDVRPTGFTPKPFYATNMQASDVGRWRKAPGNLDLLITARQWGFVDVVNTEGGALDWYFKSANGALTHVDVSAFAWSCNNQFKNYNGALEALPDNPGGQAGFSWTCMYST